MDRLGEMTVFVRVVELRSFSAAAARLGMSKSAVSRRVTELEQRLGARLINRTTRKISLTEVGQAFHARCLQILADIEEAEGAASALGANPRGLLRVTGPVSFGTLHLAPAIPAFLARYPEIELELDLSDRFVDLVEDGYDVAVRIGRLRDSSLVARRLCAARRLTVASPDYLARRGTPQRPDDLAGHDCLLYTNAPLAEQWAYATAPDAAETRPVRVHGPLRSNNGDLLRDAAVAGRGIAVLPSFIVWREVEQGRLVPLLGSFETLPTVVHAAYPASRHLSSKVRVFVDFLAERFGAEPYWERALP
jgi:DNA-binding transcriptional LysR family regulator